jgi:hypothetical protein
MASTRARLLLELSPTVSQTSLMAGASSEAPRTPPALHRPTAIPLSTLQDTRSATDLTSSGGVSQTSRSPPSTSFRSRHAPSLSHSVSTGSRPGPSMNGLGGTPPPAGKRITSGSDYFPRQSSEGSSFSMGSSKPIKASDPRALLRIQQGVVKSRAGNVLSRGFILKNDRLPPRNTHSLEFRLKGVPNFRQGGEGIYGAAQPSITGLRTVLSLLGCQPGGSGHVVWICTREEPVVYIGGSPFVLRDAEEPTKGFTLSERPEALEGIEKRWASSECFPHPLA